MSQYAPSTDTYERKDQERIEITWEREREQKEGRKTRDPVRRGAVGHAPLEGCASRLLVGVGDFGKNGGKGEWGLSLCLPFGCARQKRSRIVRASLFFWCGCRVAHSKAKQTDAMPCRRALTL